MKTERKQKVQVVALIIAILIPLIVGGVSAILTAGDMDIYETMNQPALAPPSWLFPIAWTILYILMGLASYFIFTSNAPAGAKWTALAFYFAQLVLNFFWTPIFFTYSLYLVALIVLLIMWAFVLVCVILFFRIKPVAGILMCILLLWTTFAAYLNLSYYLMSISPMPL